MNLSTRDKACEAAGFVSGLRPVPAAVLRRHLVAEIGERCSLLGGPGRERAGGDDTGTPRQP